MASILKDPKSGIYRIDFFDHHGIRRALRLPGVRDRKTAEHIALHVRELVAAKTTATPLPLATAKWLDSLPERIYRKLEAWDLAEPRQRQRTPTLGEFIAEHLQLRAAEVKPSTHIILRQAARWLLRLVDPNTPLDRISPADADRIRAELLRGRAKATANKWTRLIKEFFRAACRRGYIASNPFEHIKGLTVQGDPGRRKLIPADEVRKVLDVIPCPQFRLIVALARWAGLRIPSEIATLRWSDIDWANHRMIIRSPKTAHHPDQGVRIIPIFAEVRPYLEELWHQLPEGAPDQVITRYKPDANLRTQLNRYCLLAGVQPWPKPFQNMRATRATELADIFPSHTCAAWLGHSQAIADQFYRSVTDEHFRKAAGVSGQPGTAEQLPTGTATLQRQPSAIPAAAEQDNAIATIPSAKIQAQQKAQHQTALSSDIERYCQNNSQPQVTSVALLSTPCNLVYNRPVGPAGFEPATDGL
jgi:integrase